MVHAYVDNQKHPIHAIKRNNVNNLNRDVLKLVLDIPQHQIVNFKTADATPRLMGWDDCINDRQKKRKNTQ